MWSDLFKPLLRAARDTGMNAIESFWAAAFALNSHRPAQSQLWQSNGGQRVLVIAPHPDDETVGCAGTLTQHLKAGDRVCVAFITDGRRSRAMGLPAETMAKTRRAEAAAAMRALSVTGWEWFGLREGEWDLDVGAQRLHRLNERYHPDVIYAPSRVDFHPEHIRVAQMVAQVIAPAQCMRVYPIQVPLTSILANCIAPVSNSRPSIHNGLNAYASQRAGVLRSLRARRYAAHQFKIPGLAEEFWQMTGAVYKRLHARLDTNAASPYYSLRYSPLTDPLAYLQGKSERHALLESARDNP